MLRRHRREHAASSDQQVTFPSDRERLLNREVRTKQWKNEKPRSGCPGLEGESPLNFHQARRF
jgi:hypothetical protein